MNQILCSTGALLGKANNKDFRLLKSISEELDCDGLEFMVYSSWYSEIDELIKVLNESKLNIPVVHCHKTLGESLSGVIVRYDENNNFLVHEMTAQEDKYAFENGLELFKKNVLIASSIGAEKMVLHLWNGLASDRKIEKNIERFEILREIAKAGNVDLMVENVVCNVHDPLYDIDLLHKSYPDVSLVYDTKMAEFHGQTMNIFEPEWDWMLKNGNVKHLHINDYNGGIKDWDNLDVLPIGKGHVDFETFFSKLSKYGYKGDYTIEATALYDDVGKVDVDMLNKCFGDLRNLINKYMN